jgi:hypothetical protein
MRAIGEMSVRTPTMFSIMLHPLVVFSSVIKRPVVGSLTGTTHEAKAVDYEANADGHENERCNEEKRQEEDHLGNISGY